MYGDIRPPVKLYPMTTPEMVAGAAVSGNEGEVTQRGRTFLVTVINLLNASTKLYAPEENISAWDSSIWPGLKTDAPEDQWQFISYVGSAKKPEDWGDLTAADYDFNGEADPGKTINDAVPASAAAVDYSSMFATINSALSDGVTFGQDINSGTEPQDGAGALAFLIGLVEAKRRWTSGLSGLGLDAYDPDKTGAVEAFQSAFGNLNIQEAGALNIQVLLNYLGMRTAVAEKYNALAADTVISANLLNGAKQYYASIAPHADTVEVGRRCQEFRDRLDSFVYLLDSNGEINPPTADPAVRVGYQAAAVQFAGQLGGLLVNIENEYRGVNQRLGAGLIVGGVDELGQMIADYQAAVAAADPGRTNFAAESAQLGAISAKLSGLQNACNDPAAGVQLLFDELARPLSTARLGTELSAAISDSFAQALSKPLGDVVSVMGTNSVFRTINRSNRNRYETRKDDRYEQERGEMKSVGKSMANHKEREKQAEQRVAEQAKVNQAAAERSRENKRPVKGK